MTAPAKSDEQNILPVQALFNLDNSFNTFIGQGQPFYATTNPSQSGLSITNSTINSTTIGATTPSTGVFTNVLTTTGQVLTAPSGNTDITNKAYVDAIAQGLNPKQAVKCATTVTITLSGLQTIDGYTTLAGDRVLVKNESSSPTNGIYIADSGAWTRATDMDVWAEVPGAYCVVLYGTLNGNTAWVSTSADTGTIGTTPITFVQFAGTGTYYAGTGLTLASNTFSITNVGTAGTYGSASAVPVLAINAQGQVTSATPTSIAIAASQITSGTIASSLISGSYTGITGVGTLTAGTWNATPIANSYLANSSITINGNSVSLGGSTTVTANTPNSLTFNNGGAGNISGTTFNGGTAQTISYNTIGAPSTTGTNASGTWGINVSGNAATVTNGLYSTGSYSNPTWLTSISGGIVSGAVASATLAASATNVAGGAAGSVPYQTGAGATSFLGLGTTNYVLTAGASAPQYVAQSTLSVGSATSATTSTNLAGGGAGYIPYQSGAGATSFVSAGTTGQFLQSNGSGAPTWATPVSYASVTDDTTTNATRYPLFANQTSGSLSTEYTSSTKYQFNPSTGVLTSTSFSGAGTGLTGTASSLSIGGNAATATSATTATNLAGGAAGSLPYQASSGSTTLLAAGSNGQILTLAAGVPSWAAAPVTGITITDDTTTNATRYLTFTSATTGSITSENVSSTKLQYNPSTGVFTSTGGALFGTGSALGGTTNPIVTQSGAANNYIQTYIYNSTNNASSSADFVAYANNSTDAHGWVDVGFTSQTYADATYTVTGPNEAYLFGSAPSGSGKTGNLVYATDSTGTENVHQFYVGGFTQAKSAWKAKVDGNGLSATQLNATNGIVVNSQTVAASFTIPSGSSAMSSGPITVATGQSVTISSGSRWVVL
jgi:hypothetical protein